MKDEVQCCKCKSEVVFGKLVTEGYLCFCPNCEEDLDYHEVEVHEQDMLSVKQKANTLGVTTVMKEDEAWYCVHNRIISSVGYDNPCNAYVYGLNHIR